MKKISFVLPVVVFIAAVFMAFTSVETSKVTRYIQKPGICEEVNDAECGTSGAVCTYKSTPYHVFENRSNPTTCADELLHQ